VDEAAAREEEVEIPVQVNGKLRARLTLPAGSDEAAIEAAARSSPHVLTSIGNAEIVKVVVANRKLVNIVIRPRKDAS
jgi:leucyl-tRNA synthetase